jgi:hypothetical protein
VNRLLLPAVVAVIVAMPLAGRSAGMDAMQYYVGTWACKAGDVGKPQQNATATYTLEGGVLRQWIVVPAQGSMKMPYYLSSATTYDSKKGMYVQTNLDNQNMWSIDYAKPWTGNVEMWRDHMTADGKLTHSLVTRTNASSFSFASYPSLTSTKPNFAGSCTRS